MKYLSPEEYSTAFKTFKIDNGKEHCVQYETEFIPWDTLLVQDSFVAKLVLIKENTENRSCFFQIRTYTKAHQLISIQPFATWADGIKRYCSGVFSKKEASFTVTCDRQKTQYKFDKNGQILALEL